MTCKQCGSSTEHKRKHAQYCSRKCKDLAKDRRNADKISATNAKYYAEHREELLAKSREHFKKNKATYARYCIKRYDAKAKRTPTWLTEWDEFYIEEMYDLATRRELHVDHIIPLRGKLVSGLHVPTNLQLLSATENRRKGNRYVIE